MTMTSTRSIAHSNYTNKFAVAANWVFVQLNMRAGKLNKRQPLWGKYIRNLKHGTAGTFYKNMRIEYKEGKSF